MTTTTPTPGNVPMPEASETPLDEGGALPLEAQTMRTDAVQEDVDRSVLSVADWRRPRVKHTWNGIHVVLLILLVVVCVGPLLLLAKFAVTPTQDILKTPLAIFPNGIKWSNLHEAWYGIDISKYFVNTVILAIGSWASQLLVATTGGFVLSVLRPGWAKYAQGLVLATLFVPAVVLLVPLYLIILHPPVIDHSLVNSYWAVWLPAGASAFNVVLVARFFDNLPREIFEAAKMDGAGPFRLFWSIVLPMSKPILGVVSVFAVIASWKDFLWPLLVLRNPDLQPLSVRLPSIEATTDKGTLMAAYAIATVIPILMFLIFQRMFLRGAGLGGAVKG